MEIFSSCNTASIAPFVSTPSNAWDVSKARHVYRRLGFGANQTIINNALNLSPQAAIENLLQEARNMPNTPAPEWGYWAIGDFNDFDTENNEFINEWHKRAVLDIRDKNLKGRLSFFWLNHFVTQIDTFFYAPYTFQYWDILQTHCIGNFKTFTRDIGRNPAMLIFLNGFENTNQNPNENYARELYELFTLGEGNGYTQQDIENTSRALTGYNHRADFGGPITFDESTFDGGNKVIFGQEGPWGYDDVITILFEQKAPLIANYICTKLYTFFVSPDINQSIIDAMAATFIAQDWEIEPVLNQLFKSEHFFNEDAIGIIIKSPYDIMMNFWNEMNFEYDGTDDDFASMSRYMGNNLGQDIFQPIDVAGWQRNHDWINSSTLTGRWLGMDYMSWTFWNASQDQYRDFGRDLTQNSMDSAVITRAVVNFFLSKPLHTESDYMIAESIFRWEIPENYWEDGIWDWNFGSSPFQMILLIQHIFRMPEFQLK